MAEEEVQSKGRWSRKIPSNILFSPGGIILFLFALVMEGLDPLIPGGSLTLEIIPEVIFVVFLRVIAKVPFTASLIPFIIERLPVISDIVPTWFIRMLL